MPFWVTSITLFPTIEIEGLFRSSPLPSLSCIRRSLQRDFRIFRLRTSSFLTLAQLTLLSFILFFNPHWLFYYLRIRISDGLTLYLGHHRPTLHTICGSNAINSNLYTLHRLLVLVYGLLFTTSFNQKICRYVSILRSGGFMYLKL